MAELSGAIAIRCSREVEEIARLEPLWTALHEHHVLVAPELAEGTPSRGSEDAWSLRRCKYEGWLRAGESFFLIAEVERGPVGYAFVTVGPAYASWATGDQLATLETLSVLPECRGRAIGSALLEALWSELGRLGISDVAITVAEANEGARRFYETRGFQQGFVIYHGRSPQARSHQGTGLRAEEASAAGSGEPLNRHARPKGAPADSRPPLLTSDRRPRADRFSGREGESAATQTGPLPVGEGKTQLNPRGVN
jgi:ribosomal protein S18 acetylase RimI-like enzyme